MKTFRVRNYRIPFGKIQKEAVKFAVLSDVHGLIFGERNKEILKAVQKGRPDAVLVLGDLSVNYRKETYRTAAHLLGALAREFPVYYVYGNHEYRMSVTEEEGLFMDSFERYLQKRGVCLLHNRYEKAVINGTKFCFYGLEIPMEYYHKPTSPQLGREEVTALLGNPDRDGVRMLLAHNPKYGDAYFEWGADFIFSGHYHGGILRFSEHFGLISPQFQVFPQYCCGDFHKGDQHMYVSGGMGEHTVPVRIHNPRELLMVELLPLEKK